MKLGTVTKLYKRNKTTSKKLTMKNCDVTAIFPVYGLFEVGFWMHSL